MLCQTVTYLAVLLENMSFEVLGTYVYLTCMYFYMYCTKGIESNHYFIHKGMQMPKKSYHINKE